jgi:hypothetical protein
VVHPWNKERHEFYYTVEKNWKELYNDKAKFSVLINGWETWEPKAKNALRTYWSCEEEKKSSEKCGPQEKDWREHEDELYNMDSKVNTEFLWEDETKRIIKERRGVVDEDTDDDSGNNYEDDGEKRVDKFKENNDEEEEDDGYDNNDDNDKGHQKHRPNRNNK